ncbi:hypothetical protein CNMCM6106_000700 [Aspergillus hiratsukae]|uniref:D-lactate dehydratase n=1 Tax=Aspergillus hiratsukae TaxID=1194566 RepID=A0A8H6Q078_9EURO|nr:hypothetical protein CNMCM6106_000700 [Aspergillus hiratsukae]
MSAKPKFLFVVSSQKFSQVVARRLDGIFRNWFIPTISSLHFEATKEDPECVAFVKEKSGVWKDTLKLESLLGKSSEFAGIFFVGGHGPMFDLANNATSHALIREFYENGKVVSAVCHGPAALVNVKLSGGSYLVAGQKVTGLSDAEEEFMDNCYKRTVKEKLG